MLDFEEFSKLMLENDLVTEKKELESLFKKADIDKDN